MSIEPNSQPGSLSDEAVRLRHDQIRRGLARLNTATAVAFLISIGLALVAVFYALQAHRHAQAAQTASLRATEELWNSQLAQARALRWSGKPGRRHESLQAIQQALRIRASPELRDEAIAALALVDVEPGEFWQPMPSRVEAVGCAPDLEFYAWGDGAGRVEIYRTQGRELVGEFALSNRVVMSVNFSPDCRFVAARFRDGALRVWSLKEAKLVFASEARLDGFNEHSVLFHPNEPWLLVNSHREGMQVIDMRTWQTAAPLPKEGIAAAQVFNRDGSWLAIAGERRIAFWDFGARQILKVLELGEETDEVTHLAWHPGGNTLAVGHADGMITLVEARSGKRQLLKAHTMVVTRVAFDPRGEVLVSTSWDGSTRFWDARSGRPLLTSQAGYALAFDTGGGRLFYFKERLGLGAWNYQPAQCFMRMAVPIGNSDRILGLDFSRDGQWLAGTTTEGVHLWSRETGEHTAFVALTNTERAAFLTNSQSLVVSSSHGLYETRLTQATNGTEFLLSEPEVLPGTEGRGFWLGFLTEGHRRWFTTAAPTRVVAVDLDGTGSLQQYLWRGPRRAATISPNGRFVATSAWKGGGTRIWDTQLRREIAALEDEGGLAWFSPNGQWLAVGASTEFLFYHTATWECSARLERDVVSALSGIVAFSPDGERIALTYGVRQAQLLDANAKSVLANLNAPDPERITGLGFSPDGRFVAASTDHREIQRWDLESLERELARLGSGWGQQGSSIYRNRKASAAKRPSFLQQSRALWLSGTGACLAGVFALYSLRHHRRLIAAYAEVEAIATDNRRELKSAQSQLLHSQKMEALGTLAAGIAHDFNNLLSIIRMAGQLVERELKPSGNARQNLEDIEQAAVQGKNIVRSILGYSREPGDQNQEFSVNAVVGETLAMLSKQFLSGIVLTLELASETPAVYGDKSRLEQILLNLIVNASEAMQGKGKLTIMVRPRGDGKTGLLSPRPAAGYVELIVRDSGPGIPPTVLPRVFEPFFTTKQGGSEHGTGLGLTTVYSIARQDGLGLDLETELGQGTTFRVLLAVGRPPPVGGKA
jgi:signal transduction histidine kinase